MDVYHKILLKLYEETGGKDSQLVNFKDLVKNEGFLGNYPAIFKHLSEEGWINETTKTDFVQITHWGIMEARKSQTGEGDSTQKLRKATNLLISTTKEFLIALDEFSTDFSTENFTQVEKKITEINSAIAKLKENVG